MLAFQESSCKFPKFWNHYKKSNIKSVCILNLNDKMDKCWLLITLCFYGKWPAPNTIGSLGEIQLTIFEKYITKKEEWCCLWKMFFWLPLSDTLMTCPVQPATWYNPHSHYLVLLWHHILFEISYQMQDYLIYPYLIYHFMANGQHQNIVRFFSSNDVWVFTPNVVREGVKKCIFLGLCPKLGVGGGQKS